MRLKAAHMGAGKGLEGQASGRWDDVESHNGRCISQKIEAALKYNG